MKILILGGTGFLGPHIVEYAVERKHTVTLFNRGKTNTHLFPDLEKLRGDRDGNLEALKGRKWDAVVDTSAYIPRVVTDSAGLLKDAVRQYLFVSSISVYPDLAKPTSEDTPVGRIDDPEVEQVTGRTYGPLKALCEEAAEAAMPGRVTNVRPGLIVGPLDNSDRFTYWPVRVDRGGEVMAPGHPDAIQQVVDVRDLAGWCIRMLEDGHVGVYNAVGPYGQDCKLTMAELLYGCKVVTGAKATFTWVPDDFLEENQVGPWMELPLWIPGRGEARVDCERAIAMGLTFRPIGDTIRDTLSWHKTRPEGGRRRAGLDPEKEKKVLAAWAEKNK